VSSTSTKKDKKSKSKINIEDSIAVDEEGTYSDKYTDSFVAFSDSNYDFDMVVSSDSESDYDYHPHDDVVDEGMRIFLFFHMMLMIHALYDVVNLGEN
jgi:hypothetical protein